jgi:SpoVK/Ycf46/Vps4 family AAA+-type ATPase
MARGELLRKLFASHVRHDDFDFRAVALQIIAEEQQRHNHALAKDLLNMLDNSTPKKHPGLTVAEALPKSKERQTLLVDVRPPSRTISDIILNEQTREQLARILEEYRKSELLRLHGLRPKNKLLFCGPPGCGKTLCAEVIASEMQLSLLYTRFDGIISSYLGETAANLRQVFDYARSGTWVVLFDEFDAIGKNRGDVTEHGELKRVVNSFLQLLDGFDGNSFIIAATNHEKLLDKALWRRFDEILFFERPDLNDIQKMLALKLKNFPHQNLNYSQLARKLRGVSHADIEWVCLEAVKAAILRDRDAVTQDLLEESMARQRDRGRLGNDQRKLSAK